MPAHWTESTSRRGLGWAHQQDRARLLRELLQAGGVSTCPYPEYCGNAPLYHPDVCPNGPCWLCRLDRDHVIPRAQGGEHGPARLAHSWCNSKAGARLRHTIHTTTPARQPW